MYLTLIVDLLGGTMVHQSFLPRRNIQLNFGSSTLVDGWARINVPLDTV